MHSSLTNDADYNMGIWREVVLKTSAGVEIQYPQVSTVLSSSSSTTVAHLTVMVELNNIGPNKIEGTLYGSIEGVGSFQQKVKIAAGDTKKIFFSNDTYGILNVLNPKLWWPWQMGDPVLHTLTFNFTTDDGVVR